MKRTQKVRYRYHIHEVWEGFELPSHDLPRVQYLRVARGLEVHHGRHLGHRGTLRPRYYLVAYLKRLQKERRGFKR